MKSYLNIRRMAGLLLMLVTYQVQAAPNPMYVKIENNINYRDGGGSGTSSDPYKSLEYAYTQCNAGDTIILKAGTHTVPSSQILNASKGTADLPVTIQSSSDQWATLDYANAAGQYGIYIGPQATNIKLKSFSMKNINNGWGVYIEANNTIVNSVYISNTFKSGIHAGIFGSSTVLSGVQLLYNNISGAEQKFRYNRATLFDQGQRWNGAIDCYRLSGAQIKGNVVSKVYGEGILLQVSSYCLVQDNTVSDAYSANYYIDNCNNMTVNHNKSKSDFYSETLRDGKPSNGITLADENLSNPQYTYKNTISNNRITSAKIGLYFWKNAAKNGDNTGLQTCTFSSNVVNDPQQDLLRFESGNLHQSNIIKDNWFVYDNSVNAGYIFPGPSSAFTRTNNQFPYSLSQVTPASLVW